MAHGGQAVEHVSRHGLDKLGAAHQRLIEVAAALLATIEELLIKEPRDGGHHRRVGDLAALLEVLVDIEHGELLPALIPDELHDLGLEIKERAAQAILLWPNPDTFQDVYPGQGLEARAVNTSARSKNYDR